MLFTLHNRIAGTKIYISSYLELLINIASFFIVSIRSLLEAAEGHHHRIGSAALQSLFSLLEDLDSEITLFINVG